MKQYWSAKTSQHLVQKSSPLRLVKRKVVSFLSDQYCEELVLPHLFPTGKFGYKVKREIPLSASKYFNQRLLNHSQVFQSDSDYIFFAHTVLQRIQLNDQIKFALNKVSTDLPTAGMLKGNFKEKVKQFIARGKDYSFMRSIKGIPAYWRKFLHKVMLWWNS